MGLSSRFTKIISKFLDYDEFCTNERIRRKTSESKTNLDVKKSNNRKRDFEATKALLCSEGIYFRFYFGFGRNLWRFSVIFFARFFGF